MSPQKAGASSRRNDTDTLSDSWDNLTARVEQLRDDLGAVNAAAADLAKAGATEGKERVMAQIEEMTSRMEALRDELDTRGREAARQAGHQASVLSRELENTINRNPLTAVMVALGIGLLIGMGSRGRR